MSVTRQTTLAIGLVALTALILVAIFIPEPSNFQTYVFRVVLALGAAAVAAIIPGRFGIKFTLPQHLTVTATSAIGVFVLLYLINPPSLVEGGTTPTATPTASSTPIPITFTATVAPQNTSTPALPTDTPVPTTVATPTAKPVPAAPTDLSGSANGPTSIHLEWVDNSDNEVGWRIFRENKSLTFVPLMPTSYDDNGLKCATSYTYYVKAYNAVGESSPSGSASVATAGCPTPTAPSELAATASSSSSAHLVWKDNSDNETAFVVTQDGASIVLPANQTTYDSTDLPCGTTHTYSVLAKNDAGESGSSGNVSATLTCPLSTAPSGLAASVKGRNTISLTWRDNSNDESNFILIQDGTPIGIPANQTTYDSNDLQCATAHTYSVIAKNSVGQSDPSNTVSATTEACIPVLTGGVITFHTRPGGDDKDGDTRVDINIQDPGEATVATQVVANTGFSDNSTRSFGLTITRSAPKDEMMNALVSLAITPNGHDTWNFEYTVVLGFSDGSKISGGSGGFLVLSEGSRTYRGRPGWK